MKLLMFAGSLQEHSVNKKLIQVAATCVRTAHHVVELSDFSEFSAPLYNADIQNNVGFPPNILSFIKKMGSCDGLIASFPEYNFSVPGTVKNLIDWVSRVRPMPWKDKIIFLMSASPSQVGGNRGLWHARVSLEACGALVYPDMFSLAMADHAFTDTGEMKDKNSLKLLQSMLEGFLTLLKRLTNRENLAQ